ncbi:MAG: anaerobic ribonucleoside-triphosphate reductase activating protein [Prevotellaceae bacterium]|nr:anaerobic ribonucleoside-triphosphate reductase activating protein [Prevotellaceae bacterium]
MQGLKFTNYDIVCQEVPGEISLALNISGCPCRCPECHSKYLWADTGEPLTKDALSRLIEQEAQGATCVLFMGGDASPSSLNSLALHVRQHHPALKVAWYSGRTVISPDIDKGNFDYIKLGPYISHLGPLNKETTNQRLYRLRKGGEMEDITRLFWRKR